MILKKQWQKRQDGGKTVYSYQGWFLLGFIPLYIERKGTRYNIA